jgi:hypothetical protein
MAFRTFAVFKIQSNTVPQPMVGSWISAGIGGPSNAPITLTLGTATSAGNDATNIFKAGDHALLLDPSGANAEDVYISAVSGNTVSLGPKAQLGTGPGGLSPVTEFSHVSGAFGTGTFITPNGQANNLFVACEDGNTGTWLYIGNAFNMTATFRRIVKLAKTAAGVMPFNYGATENFFGAPFPMSELFVFGTLNDLYNVSFAIL